MENRSFKGIIPPVITPFDSKGKMDEGRFNELIEFLTQRVQGLFVCGTYGSGPMTSVSERQRTLEVAVKKVNGRVPVIAHVGSTNPEEVLALALHAQDAGASAVATVPPFYFAYSQNNVIAFFKELLAHVKQIPTYIYNNPKTTGIGIDVQTLITLQKEGLAGIKDSAFDMLYFYQVKNAMDLEHFNYISGTEAFIIPTLSMGATAAICGLANAFPEIVVELYHSVVAKDFEKAMELQIKVNKLRSIQHFVQSIPGIHAMLKMRGMDMGYPKHPYTLVSASDYDRMEQAIIQTGFVTL